MIYVIGEYEIDFSLNNQNNIYILYFNVETAFTELLQNPAAILFI